MNVVTDWPEKRLTGARRANIRESTWLPDWFMGFGKDITCAPEGTWWDWVCLARNILASENTRASCPEWYHPEYAIEHKYGGEPYEYKPEGGTGHGA